MYVLLIISFVFLCGCSVERAVAPQPAGQFPSPMVDAIRGHGRVDDGELPGLSFVLEGILPKPVDVFVPERGREARRVDLLVHFHGVGYVPKYAVYQSGQPFVVAVVNLGSGSAVYENAFESEAAFPKLIERVCESVSEKTSREIAAARICLSSFSAGYGAVRAILRNHSSMVDGIVLLDGLHTDYVPSGQVLAQGGTLNAEKLKGFVQFAELAMAGEKKLLITHSEIFPGTYASTTETTDYLIHALHLQRHSVLKWGPVGMQMLTETRANGLTILGFAGNTAPDHIDHFHGLPTFLKTIIDE